MHFSELEKFLQSNAKENSIQTYSIEIHKDGKEIYKSFYNSGRSGEISGEVSKHWIYSMTKPVTALMGVILLEKGIIDLDDKLSKYFPEYENMYVNYKGKRIRAKNEILIKDLFNMTAGFGYDVFCPSLSDIDKKLSTAEVISKLAEEPLDFEPGTAYQYGFEFDVLAAVFEKAAGGKISELYKKYIFEPLNMKNTGFIPDENIVPMCYYDGKQFLPFGNVNFYRLTDNFESGGAGLISTMGDYVRFADLLSNKGVLPNGKRLISEKSSEMFYKHYLPPQILNKNKPFERKGYSYGFGCRSLVTKRYGAWSPIGEFGWDGASGSYVLMDTANNISIVYMQDVLFWNYAYDYIHPNIRDLAYKEILKFKECTANEKQ